MKVKLFLNTLKNKVLKKVGIMTNRSRMQFLIMKAKLKKFVESEAFKAFLSLDITFVCLFLALWLLGYNWSWHTLLASFGAWQVVKEIFKQTRMVAIVSR